MKKLIFALLIVFAMITTTLLAFSSQNKPGAEANNFKNSASENPPVSYVYYAK